MTCKIQTSLYVVCSISYHLAERQCQAQGNAGGRWQCSTAEPFRKLDVLLKSQEIQGGLARVVDSQCELGQVLDPQQRLSQVLVLKANALVKPAQGMCP